MRESELAEIVVNLRAIGADIADVEVKRAAGGLPNSVRETQSAFSNTSGGVLILGLDERRGFDATGLFDAAKLSADLGALCCEDMEPPVRVLIGVHRFENQHVLVAEVPELPAGQKPCFYKGADITKGSYIRVSDGDRRLTSYEVQLLLSARGQPRDDEQPVPGAGMHDLDTARVEALVARFRRVRPRAFSGLDDHTVLRRAKVLVSDQHGGDAVSLAGLLALGTYPQQFSRSSWPRSFTTRRRTVPRRPIRNDSWTM